MAGRKRFTWPSVSRFCETAQDQKSAEIRPQQVTEQLLSMLYEDKAQAPSHLLGYITTQATCVTD